jgi:hypothetical protein
VSPLGVLIRVLQVNPIEVAYPDDPGRVPRRLLDHRAIDMDHGAAVFQDDMRAMMNEMLTGMNERQERYARATQDSIGMPKI